MSFPGRGGDKGADPLSINTRKLFAVESAHAVLTRIAEGRSDADRRAAAALAKVNQTKLGVVVLKPAEAVDAGKAKALRAVLERIATSTQASAQDQAELKRLLDSVR